jgi:hypothetical protein
MPAPVRECVQQSLALLPLPLGDVLRQWVQVRLELSDRGWLPGASGLMWWCMPGQPCTLRPCRAGMHVQLLGLNTAALGGACTC